ncbi:MAG: hypothetical protein HYZ11_02505, partial [Candidatus Tectomicrobia bacterium]|nr:hypothetical protein [Candidatus Tectomicrobia bacterium]
MPSDRPGRCAPGAAPGEEVPRMAMRGWLRVALISAAAWVVGAAPAFAHHCDSIRNHIANVDRAMSQDTTASNRNYHINQRN